MTDGRASEGARTAEPLVALRDAAYLAAVRVLGAREGADDAVQEAYLDAVRSLRSAAAPAPASLKAWFLTVVVNAARRQVRTEARRRAREAAVQTSTQAPPAQDRALFAALAEALSALEEKQRLPISLCYEQGLSQQEAAEVLGLPVGTVSTNINRGLERLRERLLRAGFAAAPAAILGGLGAAPRLAAPAALAAAIEKIVAGELAAKKTGLAAASAAAKGGLVMKVLAGVFLAGALAGGVALLMPGNGGSLNSPPARSEPVKGPPQSLHYALAAYFDYLDGPRLEAMAMSHRGSMCDDQDNLYFLTMAGLTALRCVRADNGMVETITGDDRPLNDLGLDAGPACFLPKLSTPGGFGSVGSWMSVRGAPYDGEEKGALYVGATDGPAFRVFRNKAQGGRWWFKKLSFGELKKPFKVIVESGGDLAVFCDGGYYRYDEQKGTVTPLLNVADYRDRLPTDRWGHKPAMDNIVRAEDGTFYLLAWKNRSGIYRISPDKSKCELIIPHRGGPVKRGSGFDGPALTADVDFFDGPTLNGYRPPHTLFVSAVDDGYLRRWRDGRISTWSEKDGEWHENVKRPNVAVVWFYGWCMGPRGANYAYNTYSGQCRTGDDRIFKVGPIDFDKPTAGPLIQAKGE